MFFLKKEVCHEWNCPSNERFAAKGEKSMKKVLVVILSAALCMASVGSRAMEPIQLYVNHEVMQAYWAQPTLENGYTNISALVPVRAVAEELGYTVEWDGDTNSVTVSDGRDVLKLTIDSQIYEWNGEPKILDVPPRLIQDRTFMSARYIAVRFDWAVNWDGTGGTIRIIKSPVKEEDIDLDLLVEYGIISQEDLKKDKYITTLEALTAINNVCNYGMIVTDIEGQENILEPFDKLDDDTTKGILLALRGAGYRGIFKKGEFYDLDLAKNLTNYNALVYITRMVGDASGCSMYIEEFDFTETAQTYQAAFNKGLISEIDMTNAEKPITREEFYKLLYKSMFVKFTKGGYSPTKMRYIDTLLIESETV